MSPPIEAEKIGIHGQINPTGCQHTHEPTHESVVCFMPCRAAIFCGMKRQNGIGTRFDRSAVSPAARGGRPANNTSELEHRILPRGLGRTAGARRYRDLCDHLAQAVAKVGKLDANSPTTRSRIVAAAMLTMQQEQLAHRMAQREVVKADDVVRVTHALDRALKALGLE